MTVVMMGFYKALAIFFTVVFISENMALAHEDDFAILPLKMQEGSFTSHFKDFARKFLRGSNLHHLATHEERALGEKALFHSSGITGGHQKPCTSTESQADLPIQNRRRIQSVDGEQVQKTSVDKKNVKVSEDKYSSPDSFFSLSSDSDIAGIDYTPAHKNPPIHHS